MRAVLDTSVVISGPLAHPGFELSVSALTWAELEYGTSKTTDPLERARRTRRNEHRREILGEGLPFDDAAAIHYGTVCELVMAQGRQVRGRTVDLMIAATAASHGAAVITRNPDDFAGLEGFIDVIGV